MYYVFIIVITARVLCYIWSKNHITYRHFANIFFYVPMLLFIRSCPSIYFHLALLALYIHFHQSGPSDFLYVSFFAKKKNTNLLRSQLLHSISYHY